MSLLQSKTFWVAVIYLVKTVLAGLNINVPILSDLPDSVLLGAGAITMRQAVQKAIDAKS